MLWVFNPLMQKLQRLASVEVKSENMQALEKFFTLFNELLSKVSNKPGYKFNPCTFMCDKLEQTLMAWNMFMGDMF